MKRIYLFSIVSLFCAIHLFADVKHHDQILRKADSVFDLQENTESNFQFYTSNNGIFGFNKKEDRGGGFWPRGSNNQYMFAQGFWFGCAKKYMSYGDYRESKVVTISYDPNSGLGWFVPGRVEDGAYIDSTDTQEYRAYLSTDFNKTSGLPLDFSDGPAWPLWKDKSEPVFHFGTYSYNYIHDPSKRNYVDNPRGPLFVSDEDIFATFKDTDLKYYKNNYTYVDTTGLKNSGYPIGLQVESNIYSWNSEKLKDVVVIAYTIQNVSSDTLKQCWLGGVFDIDIALYPYTRDGATNDFSRFYNEDPSKNLAVAWTCDTNISIDKLTGRHLDSNSWEKGHGFGYIGVSLLETPAVDANGFIRNDKPYYDLEEQIGLKTYRDWAISDDKRNSEERYLFMSSGQIDPFNPQMGDKRIMIATGPFNMLPGAKAHIAFAITFALPAKGGSADGTTEDLTGFKHDKKSTDDSLTVYNNSLIGKLTYLEDYYYNYFLDVNDSLNQHDPSINHISDVLYPNPASGYINLPKNFVTDTGLIRVFSMDGKLMKEIPYSDNINISDLAPGAYILESGNKIYKFIKK